MSMLLDTLQDLRAEHAPTPLHDATDVLYIDIERLPGHATVSHRGLTITGDFWDLSGWKHTIGRRIHPDEVDTWPRTICAAWNWYGQDRVHFAAEWHKGGHTRMLEKIWDAYDRAQLVIGHNIDAFDTRKLQWEWAKIARPAPSPFKTVDTLKVSRKQWGAESHTLDSLCKELGIAAKTGRYSIKTAKAAVAGDRDAQREIREYNAGDIAAGRGLYDKARIWHPSHPHSIHGAGEGLSCPSCWTTDQGAFTPNGYKLANLILYRLYRCRCGANVQGQRERRAATTRGAA